MERLTEDNYVDLAEKAIKELKEKKIGEEEIFPLLRRLKFVIY